MINRINFAFSKRSLSLEALPTVSSVFTPVSHAKVRGFINKDNKCFLNVIVQSMLATTPFYNFVSAVSKVDENDVDYPTISRFIRFFKEFHKVAPVAKSSLEVAGPGGKQNPWAAAAASASSKAAAAQAVNTTTSSSPSNSVQVGPSILPDTFYDLLKKFNPIASDWQEDSQEFFSFLVDIMHDELIHRASPRLPDQPISPDRFLSSLAQSRPAMLTPLLVQLRPSLLPQRKIGARMFQPTQQTSGRKLEKKISPLSF